MLEHWKAEGHRTLLFCQTQQMLDILERCTAAKGLRYHRMDGSTPVARYSHTHSLTHSLSHSFSWLGPCTSALDW